MKFLFVFPLLVAVASARFYGGGFGGGRINNAQQNSNALAGFGGTAIASGTAIAGRDKRSPRFGLEALHGLGGHGPVVSGREKRSLLLEVPVGGQINNADQTSNAQAGDNGVAIASGTATAGRDKRSPRIINNAQQNSNARAGLGGLAVAKGSAIAGR